MTMLHRTAGGAFLLGGLYYWMTQRHGDNGPQSAA